MRLVVQRVISGAVSAPGEKRQEIGPGLVLLLGVGQNDSLADVEYLVDKVVHLRIFEDEQGKMNLSLLDTGGEMLVISQFTLYGDCRKGRRPGFSDAARPDTALGLYEAFVQEVKTKGIRVVTGYFQAHMLVEIMNDGPVTVLLDSKKQF